TKAGAQTITATDAATDSIAGNVRVTVAPGAAATLSLDGPGSAKVGQSFNMTVTLKDPFGNVATGYRGTVHFTTSDPLPTAVVRRRSGPRRSARVHRRAGGLHTARRDRASGSDRALREGRSGGRGRRSEPPSLGRVRAACGAAASQPGVADHRPHRAQQRG